MTALSKQAEGWVLRVLVQPRSAKNAIVGLHGDALKIKLTAPPVEGAANKLCVQFLAKELGMAKSTLEIIAGHTSRAKQVLIRVPADDVARRRVESQLKKWVQV